MAKVRGVSANVEMCAWAALARLWTRAWSPGEAMRSSAVLARVVRRSSSATGREAICARGESLAWRWVSRFGGDCYDRALAMRWWCSRRGVGVTCAIGVRRSAGGEAIEGHAWTIDEESGEVYLMEDGAGYREVARG